MADFVFQKYPFQYIDLVPHALLIMWPTLLPLEVGSMFLPLVTVLTNDISGSDAMRLLTQGNTRIEPPFLISVSFCLSVSLNLSLCISSWLSLSLCLRILAFGSQPSCCKQAQVMWRAMHSYCSQ